MEDNSEEVEDMVEGLVELGVSPQDMAMTIFEDANADLASEAVHKLFYMMCEGLDAVLEGGYNIEYVNVAIMLPRFSDTPRHELPVYGIR